MRRYILLVSGCSALGILFYIFLQYGEAGEVPSFLAHADKYFLSSLGTCFLGIIVIQTDTFLDKWINWKDSFLLRFITGLGIHILLVVLAFGLLGTSIFSSADHILKLTILFIISVFIYEIFYGLFYSYQYYAVTQAEQLKSDRWQLELQFESLKSQISPHYLFNCLNTVSSLLYKDTQMAEEFVRRMADTFRYVLGHQKEKLVTLKEELDFVKSYYFLLQVRYAFHLQLEVNIPNNLMNTWVPPMTLQLLVENAVKHNAISKEQPLLVYIGARDNTHLLVKNTRTQTIKPINSLQIGLSNIQRRYGFFSKEKVEVFNNKDQFTVQMPILHTPAYSAAQ